MNKGRINVNNIGRAQEKNLATQLKKIRQTIKEQLGVNRKEKYQGKEKDHEKKSNGKHVQSKQYKIKIMKGIREEVSWH